MSLFNAPHARVLLLFALSLEVISADGLDVFKAISLETRVPAAWPLPSLAQAACRPCCARARVGGWVGGCVLGGWVGGWVCVVCVCVCVGGWVGGWVCVGWVGGCVCVVCVGGWVCVWVVGVCGVCVYRARHEGTWRCNVVIGNVFDEKYPSRRFAALTLAAWKKSQN